MTRTLALRTLAMAVGLFLFVNAASAEDNSVDWKSLQAAKVSLQKGLAAARTQGKPISGKFEVEDGALQLSTYTASKGKYYEVIVDPKSGKVAKAQQIKEGEDLSNATAQDQAMAKAKRTLRSAVSKAVASNHGYRAVSATPSLEDGNPVATIVLENAKGTKTVTEKLN